MAVAKGMANESSKFFDREGFRGKSHYRMSLISARP
jgi:hypothetical protein